MIPFEILELFVAVQLRSYILVLIIYVLQMSYMFIAPLKTRTLVIFNSKSLLSVLEITLVVISDLEADIYLL